MSPKALDIEYGFMQFLRRNSFMMLNSFFLF